MINNVHRTSQLLIDTECEMCYITEENERNLRFLIISQLLKLILGVKAWKALNLIMRRQPQWTTLTACIANDLKICSTTFPTSLDGTGKLLRVYSLQLKEGVTPTVSASHRVPSVLEHRVKAERSIQTVKSMTTNAVKEGKSFTVLLPKYSSTPTIGGKPTAELLMGRKLHTFPPTFRSVLELSFPTAPHHMLLQQRQKKQHKHGVCHTSRQLARPHQRTTT